MRKWRRHERVSQECHEQQKCQTQEWNSWAIGCKEICRFISSFVSVFSSRDWLIFPPWRQRMQGWELVHLWKKHLVLSASFQVTESSRHTAAQWCKGWFCLTLFLSIDFLIFLRENMLSSMWRWLTGSVEDFWKASVFHLPRACVTIADFSSSYNDNKKTGCKC